MKWRYARNSHPEASILFCTESEIHRLTGKAWTVWRPILRLKLKIPCLWLTRWNRSSCVYRHHPVCRGYKAGNRRIHGYRCLYRRADGKSNLSARSKIRYSRSSCFSEMKKKKNVQVCVSHNSAPMSWRIGIERFGGTHLRFLGCIWNKIEFGKERAIWSNFPKRWTSSAKSLRAQFGGTTTWGNLTTSRLYQQSSVEFGEKICKLKPNIKLRLILLKAPETQKSVFGSFNAQCWARRIWAQMQWILWEGPKPHMRLIATRDSANERVSTSFCSWSRSVRNSATTRWNACGSFAS